MNKIQYSINPQDGKKIKASVFFVEANSFEKICLWRDCNDKDISWEEDLRGLAIHLGSLDERPVFAGLFFAKIMGQQICFFEITSVVQDHHMIDQFLELESSYGAEFRSHKCDAMNFGSALRHIETLNNGDSQPQVVESIPQYESGERISIPSTLVEFNVDGNTIWIQSPEGGTTLRIKTTGKIKVDKCTNSPISHCDILVDGDIQFCIAADIKKSA